MRHLRFRKRQTGVVSGHYETGRPLLGPLAFAGGLAVIVGVFYSLGPDLAGGPEAFNTAMEEDQIRYHAEFSDLLSGANQVVTLLVSLSVGLFVLVGFALRPGQDARARLDIWDGVAGLAFLASVAFGFFHAYSALALAYEFSLHAYDEYSHLRTAFDGVRTLYAKQAMCVGISGVFAVFLATRILATPHRLQTGAKGDRGR